MIPLKCSLQNSRRERSRHLNKAFQALLVAQLSSRDLVFRFGLDTLAWTECPRTRCLQQQKRITMRRNGNLSAIRDRKRHRQQAEQRRACLCRAVGPQGRPREMKFYDNRAASSRLTQSSYAPQVTNDVGWGASLVAGLVVW